MARCSECGTTFTAESDVEFVDFGSQIGFVRASKRFYVAACNECGAAIGCGVAGK